MSQTQPSPARLSSIARFWLLIGLALVASNMRPVLSSLSPLLNDVSLGLGLSASQAGLLTTLPVLCLGLFSPLAAPMAKRYGVEHVIFYGLLVLAVSIVLRSLLGQAGLFAGSMLAGGSIGVIGVLLPGVVKRDFSANVASMTGIYTMALSLGAALAAGISVPISSYMNNQWQWALAFWSIPALLAALVWAPQLRRKHVPTSTGVRLVSLLRDPLAWLVTLYMGLQSSLAYIVFGWLPSILVDRGLSAEEAGLALSSAVVASLFSSLAVPRLAMSFNDQRWPIVIVMTITLVALFRLLYAPISEVWALAVVLGLGQGGTFSLAFTLIALRSPDAPVATGLSGMAQGLGYVIAAMGPLAVGIVHQATGQWGAVGWIVAFLGAGALLVGLGAGRERLVLTGRASPAHG
jgi:CP family cyanate transporter-like MFS transporter